MNSICNTVLLEGSSDGRWALRLARALVVATACLLGTPSSMAYTWDNVVAAYSTGNDATAFRLALPLAREGDARAQGLVGFQYMHGIGVEKDRDQAMKWLGLESEQGDAGAQANLCAALSTGNPADLDLKKGLHWCRLTAAQGYDAGLFYLGLLYYDGRGVEQNMLEAYVWLSLAELSGRDPDLLSKAAKVKAEAMKGLTVAEIAEADRRISAWKSDQP